MDEPKNMEADMDVLTSKGLARMPWLHIAVTALLLTALNAFKPVHLDDTSYLIYGAEFVAHPLNPYAFEYGTPYAAKANNTLVPPILPYWLGLGTMLLGDNPALLKCWLFPFAL